jgi:hypothetical protein
VSYETQGFFLSFTLSFFRKTCSSCSSVVWTAPNFLKDHSAFILKVNLKALWSFKMLELSAQWHNVMSQKTRIFISVLILLKLPLIMRWALSYGIANVSVSVFITAMQKHSSKLVQWQCITYEKDSNHVKIFIYFLANRQISTYTIQQHRKKTPKSTSDQLSEWRANSVAVIQKELDYRDRNVTFFSITKQINPR